MTGGNESGENTGVKESIPGGLGGLLLGPVCPGKWPVSLARSLPTSPRLEPEEKRLIGQDQPSDWMEGPPAQGQGHGPLALQNTSAPPPRAKPPLVPLLFVTISCLTARHMIKKRGGTCSARALCVVS